MKKQILLIALLAFTIGLSAQTTVKLTVNHLLGSSSFAMNSEAENDLGEKLKINRLEYYISGISITHDGGKTTSMPDVYILAYAAQNDTFSLGSHDISAIEAINFSVGVDPGVNTADPAQWASFHPLAPKSPSMHWGWASGYRFVALEGKSGIDFSRDFQIHALGNKNYFKQSIPTDGTMINGALVVSLNADYTKAISQIGMGNGLIQHGEDAEAATCLRNFQTKVFTSLSGEGNTLSTKDLVIDNAFNINPVPSNGPISITLNDNRLVNGSLVITDLAGKVIHRSIATESNTVSIAPQGVYFLTIYRENYKSTKKLIIQ